MPKVKRKLYAEPCLSIAPSRFLQPNCHVGGDAAPAIEKLGQRLTGNTKPCSRGGNSEPKRLETIFSNNFTRVWRVMHFHGLTLT